MLSSRQGRDKVHRPSRLPVGQRHLPQGGVRQRVSGGIQARQAVWQLLRTDQPQVALGQQTGLGVLIHRHPHQRAQPMLRLTQAGLQHLRVARGAHAVGQHARPTQPALVMLQAKSQRAKGARHGRGIDHRHHRQAQALRQIGRTGLTIKQAHDTFNEDQVAVLRRSVQTGTHIGLAGHPHVHRVHRGAAGKLVPVRVEKIRSALEHPHPPPLARVQARQRSHHGGLALARCRGRDEQSWAACHGHHRAQGCGAHFRPTYSVRPGGT